MILTKEQLHDALVERHGVDIQAKLDKACVGIAGLGGLGSNLAIFLARLGVGHLILVDFDVVDITNLNRQHYTMKDRRCDRKRLRSSSSSRPSIRI